MKLIIISRFIKMKLLYFFFIKIICLHLLNEAYSQNFWVFMGIVSGGSSNTFVKIHKNEFLCAHSNGIFKTTNEGINWNKIYNSPEEFWVLSRDDSTGELYGAYNFYYSWHSGIYKSIDNGYNWFITGLQNDTRKILDIKVNKNGHIYVGCWDIDFPWVDAGMFLSTNKGISWEQILNGLYNIKAIAIDSFGCIYAATQDLGSNGWALLLRTCDNGNSWNSLFYANMGHYVNKVDYHKDSLLIIATSAGKILMSTNYGKDWVLCLSSGFEVNDLKIYDKYLFVIGYDIVKISKDKGLTWLTLNSGLQPWNNLVKVLRNENGILYLLSKNGCFYKSRYSIFEPKIPSLVYPENNSSLTSTNVVFKWKNYNLNHANIFQIASDSTFNNIILDTSEIFDSLFHLSSGILHNGKKYYWRVKSYNLIDSSRWSQVFNFKIAQTGVENNNTQIPINIRSIFPNPSNNIFNISFFLLNNSYVKIEIYSSMGQCISGILNSQLNSGEHFVKINTEKLTSGIYFIKFSIDKLIITKKINVIK